VKSFFFVWFFCALTKQTNNLFFCLSMLYDTLTKSILPMQKAKIKISNVKKVCNNYYLDQRATLSGQRSVYAVVTILARNHNQRWIQARSCVQCPSRKYLPIFTAFESSWVAEYPLVIRHTFKFNCDRYCLFSPCYCCGQKMWKNTECGSAEYTWIILSWGDQ
jgi:hypothetical protein